MKMKALHCLNNLAGTLAKLMVPSLASQRTPGDQPSLATDSQKSA